MKQLDTWFILILFVVVVITGIIDFPILMWAAVGMQWGIILGGLLHEKNSN